MTYWHTSFTKRGGGVNFDEKLIIKEVVSLWANHKYLQNQCKLKWAKVDKL